jgi:hypothetical protein
MSEIYASACLTLIAAQGPHADSGLPGFTFTTPREVHQSVVTIGSEKLVTPVDYQHSRKTQFEKVVYYTRGWTFQENEFGRRRLIFEQQSMRWECRVASWCEDLKDMPTVRYKGKQWDTEEMPDPGPEDLNEIINVYNERQLGRQEDAFSAFCGFQRVLGRSYKPGMVNGMPVKFFDVVMAWIPISVSHGRRKAENPDLLPPSWSWLGWTGMVDIKFSTDDHVLKDRTYSSHFVNKRRRSQFWKAAKAKARSFLFLSNHCSFSAKRIRPLLSWAGRFAQRNRKEDSMGLGTKSATCAEIGAECCDCTWTRTRQIWAITISSLWQYQEVIVQMRNRRIQCMA